MSSLDLDFQISQNSIHVLSYRTDFWDLQNLVFYSVEILKPGSIEPKNQISHEWVLFRSKNQFYRTYFQTSQNETSRKSIYMNLALGSSMLLLYEYRSTVFGRKISLRNGDPLLIPSSFNLIHAEPFSRFSVLLLVVLRCSQSVLNQLGQF